MTENYMAAFVFLSVAGATQIMALFSVLAQAFKVTNALVAVSLSASILGVICLITETIRIAVGA